MMQKILALLITCSSISIMGMEKQIIPVNTLSQSQPTNASQSNPPQYTPVITKSMALSNIKNTSTLSEETKDCCKQSCVVVTCPVWCPMVEASAIAIDAIAIPFLCIRCDKRYWFPAHNWLMDNFCNDPCSDD